MDVFYVKDLFGLKITSPTRLETIRQRLLDALAEKNQGMDETASEDSRVSA